ncbi:hypothetical protein H8K47_00650 [Undibacterium sp. CY7W]|uniref:Uncharacterized protein n=1 Tax=Undibacterium rugosum TaxID=2762291 RepID=A0A923I729_9BURK|nr:hypothetical protein [Undibacterium rugosum]MBC3933855.1 hypothetical protein [Undibacterium rugosum]
MIYHGYLYDSIIRAIPELAEVAPTQYPALLEAAQQTAFNSQRRHWRAVASGAIYILAFVAFTYDSELFGALFMVTLSFLLQLLADYIYLRTLRPAVLALLDHEQKPASAGVQHA